MVATHIYARRARIHRYAEEKKVLPTGYDSKEFPQIGVTK